MIGPGEIDLEALDAYLMSDESPENCMQLSDLDGFLTAIVVGPELIKPSEWLPVVWGQDSPEFETEEQAKLILGSIMARYNEIARSLSGVPAELEPIFWETKDGIAIAGDWAEGFMGAMQLRPGAWAELLDDEKSGRFMIPILAFVSDEEDSVLPRQTEERKKLVEAAANLIPDCVVKIDKYWKARRHRVGAQAGASRRPGRNDPCPCGSGRKYKRCCGAN
jgi:uncharacterized protein